MENVDLGKILGSDLEEDSIEYFLYPKAEDVNEEFLREINKACEEIIGNYLWHKDSFVLKLESDHFYGITRFGENVEDEWFIVRILILLTEKFQDVIARVTDNEGEFLLIEAAECLPNWADSDKNCLQRVYISKGKVHLIPPSLKYKFSAHTPPIPEAIEVVKKFHKETKASNEIQTAIVTRIEKMMKENRFHEVNVMLPPILAQLLELKPQYISAAVQAFHFRDPLDLRSTRLMNTFKPANALVMKRIRFTRYLYAMLSKQEFRPDSKSGWPFPRPNTAEFKAHSIGAKLTLAFEILLSRKKKQISSSSADSAGWIRFSSSLRNRGYFKDFLEGSKPFTELEAKAREFFDKNMSIESPFSFAENSLAEEISTLLNSLDTSNFNSGESAKIIPDDDESWLEIKPEDLDSLLEAQFKSSSSIPKPEDIPAKLKEFMSQLSGIDGVETPGDKKDKIDEGEIGAGDFDSSEVVEPLDFRADDFVTALDKLLLELGKPDHDWDESEEEISDTELEAEVKAMYDFKEDSKIHQLMKQMDTELEGTDVGKTFAANVPGSEGAVQEGDEFGDVESFEPVNIDMNTLKNILESFQSQEGPAGPSANLLRSVGFDLSKMKN